ncbi:MAG: DNA polymerase III subunit delta' [Polaromonas sp.]|nr:DNA polymerase III subunit delta' [Polaromonas sp.]
MSQALAPWLQSQLESLLTQRGHAWLLSGPSGLGQFDLALALARAWLCEAPTPQGACGQCGSCHAVDVHTHADLCMLMPETLSLALGWPLDQKTQEDLDAKKRKPSKEIKVDAAREAVSFTQFTRSRGNTKLVLVFPAERMNHITANTLLKTLEEPPGEVKFVLATQSAEQLLPTIRSRCLAHTMRWPGFEESLDWLAQQSTEPEASAGEGEEGVKSFKAIKAANNKAAPPQLDDLRVLLAAAGGRPSDALDWVRGGASDQAARDWRALPKAMARGDVSALADWAPPLAVDALQKLCHDMWAVKLGAQPRFFSLADLPLPARRPGIETALPAASAASIFALSSWSKELATTARTAEHPYNPGLMLEALVSRARLALNAR